MKQFSFKNFLLEYGPMLAILIFAFILRLLFPIGHAFTDDSHYLYLAELLASGDSLSTYVGYPVMPQRVGLIATGALFIKLIGIWGAVFIWPMILSLCGILLLFHLTKILTRSHQTALIAAFLLTIFPMDIAFASFFMSDAGSAFFLFLGVFLILKGRDSSWVFGLGAGLSFWIALLFKMSALFALLPLGLLFLFQLFRGKLEVPLLIALVLVPLGALFEGFVYWNLNQDFMFRFHQMAANFQQLPYDFFTLESPVGFSTEAEYWTALMKRFFLDGPRAILFRRFYLFIPFIALCSLPTIFRKGKRPLKELGTYYVLLLLIFNFCSSSWTHYQPLPMHLPWYPWFLFMPALILVAIALRSALDCFRSQHRPFITAILACFIILVGSYHAGVLQSWFNRSDLQRVCVKISGHPVLADPFTHMALQIEKVESSIPDDSQIFDHHANASFLLWNQMGALEANSLGIPFQAFIPDSSWILLDHAGGHRLYQKLIRP